MNFNLKKLSRQIDEQAAQLKSQQVTIESLLQENKVLRQKVQSLLKRLFGSKSEKIDSKQLELLLGLLEQAVIDNDDDNRPPPSSPRPRKPRDRKPRLPEDLPTEDVIIDPDEVKEDPQSYLCIGEEVTEELDVIPQQYFRRRIIRRKYKSKADREQPPIIAPLLPRLIEGGYASPGILTDIVLKKYEDHLPLYRQEQILKNRFGIDLSRKTMCDWVRVAADWLKPIYNHIGKALQGSGYLQIDETPIKYCNKDGPPGGRQGYFWLYHHPGGDVRYEWHTSRAAECLDEMLSSFSGTVQCDGYSSYISYAKDRDDIDLAGCWSHARRKFHEAIDESPGLAGWFLNQIGLLYRIEADLRDCAAGPHLRQSVRGAQSRMILNRIGKALRLKLAEHLPQSQMGKAIGYALRHWDQLLRYCDDGRIEIDNNLVENAVRPTAIGKKNWLQIGHPEAGNRSAIIYTILASCRRHGINPQEYLRDVFTRLPAMKITQVAELTPASWIAQRRKKAA